MTTMTEGRGPNVDEMTWLSTFDEVDEVLRSREFVQAAHQDRDSAPLIKDSLITLAGEHHFGRRRLEASLFAKEALSFYDGEVLASSLQEVIASCERFRGADGVVRVDVLPVIRLALLRVTAAMVGLDGVDDHESAEQLRLLAERLGEGAAVEWSTRDHDVVIAEALAAKERFVEQFYAPSYERRAALVEAHSRGEIGDDELPPDLLTVIIRHRRDDWDDDLLVREAVLFLVASSNTTTNATPHVLAELARWLEAHPEHREQVGDVNFLRRAANEALRLHPPVPALLRRATVPATLAGGRRIEEGEYVALDLVAANTDPAVFGEAPETFNPLRQGRERTRPFGFTFGGGAHMCIGRTLAVGNPNQPSTADDPVLGALVRILLELYRAGVRPDPDEAPRMRGQTVQEAYVAYPVCLDLPGGAGR